MVILDRFSKYRAFHPRRSFSHFPGSPDSWKGSFSVINNEADSIAVEKDPHKREISADDNESSTYSIPSASLS